MNDDQLLDRIGRLDPVRRGARIDPITSPSARALLEDIMDTPHDTEIRPTDRRPMRWTLVAAAAVVAAIVGVGAFVLGGDDDPAPEVASTQPPTTAGANTLPATTGAPAKGTVLELNTGVEDLLASCAVLDPAIVGQAPIAFQGTVTLADAGVVQLTVDRVYRGVDAQAVTLLAPEGQEALIGGVAWEVGGSYLVSAYEDTVAYCGQSGPATPELQAIYDEAFAAG